METACIIDSNLRAAVVQSGGMFGEEQLLLLAGVLRGGDQSEVGPVAIGGREFFVGLESDGEFKYFFLTLSEAGTATFSPFVRRRELPGRSFLLTVPGGAVYRGRLNFSLTSPIRSSKITLTPVGGGPALTWTSGELLDLLEKQAASFELNGSRYYLAYHTDMDPVASTPALTRCLLFFREGRFLPKAWRLAEADLPAGRPVAVKLDGETIVLERDARGGLSVTAP